MYSNSTMKAMRAGLNRYFKEKRSIDISSDSQFIHTNEIFKGLLKINKESGRGTVVHKKPISNADMNKLFQYFKENMAKPPLMLANFRKSCCFTSFTSLVEEGERT